MKSAKQNAATTFPVTTEYVDSINAALGISHHERQFKLLKGSIEFSRSRGVNTPNKERVTSASDLISKSNDCINQIIAGELPTLEDKRVMSIITEESNRFGYNMLVAALVYKNKQAALNIINSLKYPIGESYNQILSLAIFAFDDTEVLNKLIEKRFIIITNDDSHPAQVATKLGKVDALELLKEKFPKDIKNFEAKNPGALTIKSTNTVVEMASHVKEEKREEPTAPTVTQTTSTASQTTPKKTPKKTLAVTQTTAQSRPKQGSKEESVWKAASQLIALITQWSVKKEVTEAALLGANPKHRNETIAWEDVICQEVGVKNVGQQNCILAALRRIQAIYSNKSIKEQSRTSHLKAAREVLNLLLSKITNISKLKNQEALFAKALELLELDGGECYTTLSSKGLKATEEQQLRYEQYLSDIDQEKSIEEKRQEVGFYESHASSPSEEVAGKEALMQPYNGTPSRSSGYGDDVTGGGDDDYKVEPINLNPVFDAETSAEAQRAEAERQRLLAEEAAKQKLADEKAAAEAETEKQRLAAEEAQRVEAERQRLATEEAAAQKAAAEAEAERQRLAAEEAQRAEAERQKLADEKAAKQARASKCKCIGAAFSTTLTGALCYATYANQELVLSMATSVLEHTYFTAAHTALANTEYGSMIISFVMENSQECMIAAASLAIVASLITSYCFAYKIADMTIAKAPEAQTVA